MDAPITTLQVTCVMLRCCRWGVYLRWLADSGGFVADPRPLRLVSWWWKLVLARNVQGHGVSSAIIRSIPPVSAEEATQTQRCIDVLPEHLRDTMIEEYLMCGTADQKAEALGIKPRQFRDRREQAHVLLVNLLNDAEAGLPLTVGGQTRGRRPTQRGSA